MVLSVSFCISTYFQNDKRFSDFKKALNSVLELSALEIVDYEIVVSIDGDNADIQSYVSKINNKNIKCFVSPGKGQFANLNNLVNKAKNPWMVFLHDDDILHQNYLIELKKVTAPGFQDCEIFFTERALISEDGTLIKSRTLLQVHEDFLEVIDGRKVFERIFFGGFSKEKFKFTAPMVTGLCIKRDLVKRIGGFDDRLYVNSDALFLNKAFYVCSKVLYSSSPLVYYRIVDDSERARPSKKGIVYHEMKKLLEFTLEFLKEKVSKKEYTKIVKEKTLTFYKNTINLNGPLLWIALRFEGSYFKRMSIIFDIVKDIARGYREAFYQPKFYIVLLASFLPQPILSVLYRFYIKQE